MKIKTAVSLVVVTLSQGKVTRNICIYMFNIYKRGKKERKTFKTFHNQAGRIKFFRNKVCSKLSTQPNVNTPHHQCFKMLTL